MSKKYNIGDKVTVNFLGSQYKCTIVENYYNRDRTVDTGTYWVVSDKGLRIPDVHVDGKGKWANIVDII